MRTLPVALHAFTWSRRAAALGVAALAAAAPSALLAQGKPASDEQLEAARPGTLRIEADAIGLRLGEEIVTIVEVLPAGAQA